MAATSTANHAAVPAHKTTTRQKPMRVTRQTTASFTAPKALALAICDALGIRGWAWTPA